MQNLAMVEDLAIVKSSYKYFEVMKKHLKNHNSCKQKNKTTSVVSKCLKERTSKFIYALNVISQFNQLSCCVIKDPEIKMTPLCRV